jgi:hypothetical protein
LRDVWLIIVVVAVLAAIVVVGLTIQNRMVARNAAYSEAVVRARDVRDDLTAMLRGGERYLRSGGKKDLADYTRASADLPKDAAVLSVWTDDDAPALKPRTAELLQYMHDESEVIHSTVMGFEVRHTKFSPKLAEELALAVAPTDEKVDRAERDLETAAGGLHN